MALANEIDNFNESSENIMRTGNCQCYRNFNNGCVPNPCYCPENLRIECCPPIPPTPPIVNHTIFASLFSDDVQTVNPDSNIAFEKDGAVTVGMSLNAAGTALTVHRNGFYNITFGVEACGIASNPEVCVLVNSQTLKGAKLLVASANVMNSLTRIAFLHAGDVIHLRDRGGTLVLQSGHVNVFLDVTFIGDGTI